MSSRGDLGWSSCEVKQKVESVRLWCRLQNMPEHRIVRRVHNWSLAKGRSCEKKMLQFIDTHSLSDLMLATNPNKPSCVSVATHRIE